jgi:plasmid stability protein
MPTLYVRNVPQGLYDALRKRARASRRSMAAEVLTVLAENVPTANKLRARKKWFQKVLQLRSQQTNSARSFSSAEEMIREDRER